MLYGMSISIAHLFEYLYVCGYHPEDLHWDSFLINQSAAYIGAHVFALTEFCVEFFIYISFEPSWMKFDTCSRYMQAIGFSMVITGHFFRISAMFTAARSFHH